MNDNDLERDSMMDVRLDENGIIWWITYYTEKNEKKAREDVADAMAEFDRIFDKHQGKKFDVMIDVKRVEKDSMLIPKDVRERYSQLMKHAQIRKVAIVGASRYIKLVGEMIIRFSNRLGNVRFFKTIDEGLKWIHDNSK